MKKLWISYIDRKIYWFEHFRWAQNLTEIHGKSVCVCVWMWHLSRCVRLREFEWQVRTKKQHILKPMCVQCFGWLFRFRLWRLCVIVLEVNSKEITNASNDPEIDISHQAGRIKYVFAINSEPKEHRYRNQMHTWLLLKWLRITRLIFNFDSYFIFCR